MGNLSKRRLSILSVKFTEQQQKRNEKYNKYVEHVTPTHSLAMNMFKAFILGGIICCLGQLIMNVLKGQFGVDASEAPVWCSMILVLISCILTSINLYAPLANWGGAGALVPITGFANAVVSPAIDNKSEGFIMGVGAKMFVVAGPVIVYGIISSVLYGVVYYIVGLF